MYGRLWLGVYSVSEDVEVLEGLLDEHALPCYEWETGGSTRQQKRGHLGWTLVMALVSEKRTL